jgi:ABC-type multidrug transport system fused ATPase/permease subunit
MSLKNVRFAWQPSSSNKTGINLKIDSCSTGTLVLIIGPVGSGKSTLLKGLAGETPVIEGDYFIKHPDMAFCDQKPWLINASIKDNIVGNSKLGLDNEWYRTVISACSLDTDFMKMPEGDQTEVGSQGDKLSGGQKQRIVSSTFQLFFIDFLKRSNGLMRILQKTIARALYSRKRISCFDDVLSGLDNATSKLVFNRVFGSNGLLRRLGGVTFLATHSSMLTPPRS